jgi:stage II sporulation protein D
MYDMKIFPNTALYLCIALLAGCASSLPDDAGSAQPFVRVCIAERSREMTLGIQEGSVLETATQTFSLDDHRQLRCVLEEDGSMSILVDGRKARSLQGAFRCYTRRPGGSFSFEDDVYTDTLLVATDGQGLYLVNILPVETYLEGVVPNEIGRNRKAGDFEAVKAQAILARTYVLRKIQLPLTRLYDVHADTRDQVFSGSAQRDAFASAAIAETRGLVLTAQGKPAECYYHSTCGGQTEASSLVWKRPQSQPWLIGVEDRSREGDYCRISPSYRWTEEYDRESVERTVRVFLPAANDAILPEDIPAEQWYLLDLNIIKRMPSGRVATLQIVMGNRARQRAYYVHGDNVRKVLRRTDSDRPLRSTLFDIDLTRDANRWIRRIRIDGGGAGHGVGMCQWGAIGRARSGYGHAQILNAYFPGTGITRLY